MQLGCNGDICLFKGDNKAYTGCVKNLAQGEEGVKILGVPSGKERGWAPAGRAVGSRQEKRPLL